MLNDFYDPCIRPLLPTYYKGMEIALINGLGPSYKVYQGQIFNQRAWLRKFKLTWLIKEVFLFTVTSI